MPNIILGGKASDFLKIGVTAAARGDLDRVRELLELQPKWLHPSVDNAFGHQPGDFFIGNIQQIVEDIVIVLAQ